jgi:hypothetical protein
VSSPKAVVRAVHRILRPGGLFTLSTPNIDSLSVAILGKNWIYIGGNDHLYLFDCNTLSRLLTDNGFSVVRLRTKGVHLTVKNHTCCPSRKPLSRALISISALVERPLEFVVRQTLKGHRLKIWARKV